MQVLVLAKIPLLTIAQHALNESMLFDVAKSCARNQSLRGLQHACNHGLHSTRHHC